ALGAVALGAVALGAVALGAVALGAVALGAIAKLACAGARLLWGDAVRGSLAGFEVRWDTSGRPLSRSSCAWLARDKSTR
ncbi:MAG TPA: hypothetical protein VER96_01735, partial [Polyangiaceae bacterium]|nr:hypothetical protein [Polyangiaceae bacterium]